MAIRTETIAQVAVVRWSRAQDWLTLLLLGSAVVVVMRSVEVARWVPAPSLSLTAALGVLAGFLAVRLPWKTWQGHLLASVAGALVVYMQSSTLADGGTFLARLGELNARLVAWWTALLDNDISTDTIPFAFILTGLAWAAGYLGSWAIFRRGNVWLAVLPSAFGLLMNLTYLPEKYYFHLFPFLLATMLLMVRLHSVQQTVHLARQGIGHPRSLRILWLVAGLVFSSLIVGSVFLLPPNHARNEALVVFWNASRRPVEWFQGEFGRLFSAVGGKLALSTRRFSSAFPILPTKPAGTEPVFSGSVSYPAYWKVRAYTTYNSGGWTTDDTVIEPALSQPPLLDDFGDPGQGEISYQVTVSSSTPYMYIPSPNNSWVSVTAQVERHDAASASADALTIRPKKRLEPGDSYTGSFPSPFYPESLLRATGQEYPQWVKDSYLGLPTSLPQRIRTLALRLTQDAANPYDKAAAIEKYLRSNYKYGTVTSLQGFNEDRVDHFLFQSKVGHSDHFASAMAVMLRAVGVPARLVSGFGPGVADEEGTAFTVTEGDQHSWTEAYMPQVGWIEFEPSPIYPLRPRQAGDLAGFGAGLIGISSGDALPEEPGLNNNLEESDPGGGRLPGGEGLRPFPLILRVSPWSSGGVFLMALMAMWVAGLMWVWRRFFLHLPRPEMAFARMHRMARLLVVEPPRGHTPMEFGTALATAIPESKEDILFICDAFCRARYGNAKLAEQDGLGLRLAWNRVRKALMRYTLN
ncbi:MAG: transglutaminase domain-containing protein [Dehalococcoidia bacterium]|nr:transglutaminase domain-containing protein [Dehalococcoidia bacterium]